MSIGDVTIQTQAENNSYQTEVLERLAAISALNERKDQDYLQLSGLVLENGASDETTHDTAQMFSDVIRQIEQINAEMRKELTFGAVVEDILSSAESSFQQGRDTSMEMFLRLIDPLLVALDKLQKSVLSKMGIDNIPVVPHIREIILNIKNIARVVNSLPQKDREEAKKEETEEGTTDTEEDSIVQKVVLKLKETLMQAMEVIQKIISCIEPFLIMMLIDKIKPVVEYFSLQLGQIYQIAEDAYTVAKLLIYNQAALLDLFAKTIMGNLEEIWAVVKYYIKGAKLPADADIKTIVKDIVSCDFDIEENQMRIDLIQANQELYSNKTMLKTLERGGASEEVTKDLRESINVKLPIEIDKIKTGIDVFKANSAFDFIKKCEILYNQHVVHPLPLTTTRTPGIVATKL